MNYRVDQPSILDARAFLSPDATPTEEGRHCHNSVHHADDTCIQRTRKKQKSQLAAICFFPISEFEDNCTMVREESGCGNLRLPRLLGDVRTKLHGGPPRLATVRWATRWLTLAAAQDQCPVRGAKRSSFDFELNHTHLTAHPATNDGWSVLPLRSGKTKSHGACEKPNVHNHGCRRGFGSKQEGPTSVAGVTAARSEMTSTRYVSPSPCVERLVGFRQGAVGTQSSRAARFRRERAMAPLPLRISSGVGTPAPRAPRNAPLCARRPTARKQVHPRRRGRDNSPVGTGTQGVEGTSRAARGRAALTRSALERDPQRRRHAAPDAKRPA